MKQQSMLLAIVLVIMAIGAVAGFGQLFLGSGPQDQWSPRNYVAKEGECFVPPQGDPLYDEHYAKNVNNPNCDSLLVQSQSKFVDARTESLKTETFMEKFGLMLFLGVLASIVLLLLIAILKGNATPQQ